MEISELVKVFISVSGLDENQAKTSIYYAMATHNIDNYIWFPALCYIGPPGTGKSKALDVMEKLCNQPFRITCHNTMTAATLRDELISTKKRVTALIEEADLCQNRKQLQSYIINRVDKMRTSGVPVKEQVETNNGVKGWRTHHRKTFGATVIHDRNSLDDLAAESRAIVINTVYKTGAFTDPPDKLSLPTIKLDAVPDYFTDRGRAFDTWKPLLEMASGQDDVDWLIWAHGQILDSTENLKDGHAYEEKQAIFAKVIEAICNNTGGILIFPQTVILDKDVTEPLRKTTMPHITPHLVKKTLVKMKLNVKRHSGTNKLFVSSLDELKKVARDIGYEDELLV